jgi:hypothetical protein
MLLNWNSSKLGGILRSRREPVAALGPSHGIFAPAVGRNPTSITGSGPPPAMALGADAQRPRFTGMAGLCHGVTIEPGRKSFDRVVRLSTLGPRARITIPTRKTRVLNKWLSMSGARMVQGCAWSEKAIVIWVEFPQPQAREGGDVIGIDVGINKLIATSDARAIGQDWRQISARVRRRRRGSKGKRRARIARDHSINHAVKQSPWQRLSATGFEDLNGLKKGKSATGGKNFRKAAAPSTYRRVRQRIDCLAAENRVLPIAVDPRGTSRTGAACVVRTIGATARERCLAVSPAITQAMPISSALETS